MEKGGDVFNETSGERAILQNVKDYGGQLQLPRLMTNTMQANLYL